MTPSVRGLALSGTALSSISLSKSWYIGTIDLDDETGRESCAFGETAYDFGSYRASVDHHPQKT